MVPAAIDHIQEQTLAVLQALKVRTQFLDLFRVSYSFICDSSLTFPCLVMQRALHDRIGKFVTYLHLSYSHKPTPIDFDFQ